MRRFSLSKEEKIVSGADFKRIVLTGRRFRAPLFDAVVLKNNTDSLRLGISVSRRVGNAVLRNRIKRVVREWFRFFKNEGVPEGWDLVVIFKFPVTLHETGNISSMLSSLFGQSL